MKKYELIITAVALSVIVFTFFGCSGDDGEEESHSFGSLEYGGQTYKTIVIGEQTWMAENLNYKTETGSYCLYEGRKETYIYDYTVNDYVYTVVTPQMIADNCAKYGRLYEHETAKTVCPNGWHLPSNAEWNELVNYVGDNFTAGTKLKATKGWDSLDVDDEGVTREQFEEKGNGTDDYGFSALPGSCRTPDKGDPVGGCLRERLAGYWWSMDDYETTDANNPYFSTPAAYYQTIVFVEGVALAYRSEGFGFSVRCVKD